MAPLAKHIFFPTDFSPCSEHAFLYALALAQRCQAKLDVLHVLYFYPGLDVDTPVSNIYLEDQQKNAQPKLESLIERAKTQLEEVSGQLVLGTPEVQINQLAMERDADLLVIGTHGWTGWDRVLLGSTAERVVREAPCPVITVRGPKDPIPSSELEPEVLPQHVLVPIDFSDCSLDAFEYAIQLAKTFEAGMTLLHVVEPLSYSLDFQLTHLEDAKKKLLVVKSRIEELTAVVESQGIHATFQLGEHPALDTILTAAKDAQANVIVMGTHGRRGILRLVMGSIAAGVLRHATCPVVAVKSPKYHHAHPQKSSVN